MNLSLEEGPVGGALPSCLFQRGSYHKAGMEHLEETRNRIQLLLQ